MGSEWAIRQAAQVGGEGSVAKFKNSRAESVAIILLRWLLRNFPASAEKSDV